MCNRHLDSTTVNDGPDGDIYCRTCYAAKFGMKGYGFGQGAGTLMSVCIIIIIGLLNLQYFKSTRLISNFQLFDHDHHREVLKV